MVMMTSLALVMTSLWARPAGSDAHFDLATSLITTAWYLDS